MEYVLTANNLYKSYNSFKALSGLSIHVPKGSIYGLIGKNGAGKTTLIRIICGLQSPTLGDYTLYGVENRSPKISRARRKMGAVVETPSIYLDMSAEDNLKQQCRILGLPDFSCVPELLETVCLENAGRKKSRNFSLGMKQRLGIAVALCGSPDFLVLDEPTNGLDPQGIVEIRELIIRLNRERNITFLISSHILDELSKLATCYGFIDGGKTVKEISSEELEAACRKCRRVKVTDIGALCRTLDDMKLEYSVISDSEADIFGNCSVTKLSENLYKSGCELISVSDRDESLESYFISLVG